MSFSVNFTAYSSGTLASAMTTASGHAFIGDVANYQSEHDAQGSQITVTSPRTHADGQYLEVENYTTDNNTTQDYEFYYSAESALNSDFNVLFGGDDPDNCYQARLYYNAAVFSVFIYLYRIENGNSTYIGNVNRAVTPQPNGFPSPASFTVRHSPEGITLAQGETYSVLIDDTTYSANGKKLYFFIEHDAAVGTGLHVRQFYQNGVDTIKPVITNNSATPYKVPVGEPYVAPDVTALDNIDGDITANLNVVGVGSIDVNTLGSYFITYDVDDAAGNSADQLLLEVQVVEPENIPELFEPGTYTVSINYTSANGTTAADSGSLVVPPPALDITPNTAFEVDTANSMSPAFVVEMGTASETNTSSSFSAQFSLSMGTGLEVDSANSMSPAMLVQMGTASEVDSAYSGTLQLQGTPGTAFEIDTAGPFASGNQEIVVLGTATEVDSAGSFGVELVVPQPIELTPGTAFEIDTANPFYTDFSNGLYVMKITGESRTMRIMSS